MLPNIMSTVWANWKDEPSISQGLAVVYKTDKLDK
jgi:hypothetical protein